MPQVYEKIPSGIGASEESFRALLHTIPDLAWVKDIDGRYLRCNKLFERYFGVSEADIAGKSDYDFVSKHLADAFREDDLKAIASGTTQVAERWLSFAEDGYLGLFETLRTPIRNQDGNLTGVLGIARDVSARKRTEQELLKLNRSLIVHTHCTQALVRATSEQQLIDEMCHILVAQGGYALAAIGFAENDKSKCVRICASHGDTGYLDGLQISWADEELGHGPTGTAIRTGQTVWSRDIRVDASFEPWRTRAEHYNFRSAIALPLGSAVPAIGALLIYSTTPNRFNEEEVRLLEELANDVAYGIQSLRAEQQRRESEQKLRESNERFREISENIRDVFYLVNPDSTQFLYASPAYEEVWGLSLASLYADPLSWTTVIHPEDRDAATKVFWRV